MCFYYNENEASNTHELIRRRVKDELTQEQIYRLIDEMASMKVRVLTIHGGEPLVYPGIFETAKYAAKKGVLVNFITNGALINAEVAEKIADAGIGNITFSIDGPRDIHDKVRNREGTFDRMMQGIRHLKEIEKKGRRIPNLSVSTYISGINAASISELHEIIREAGIKNWGVGIITYNSAKLTEASRKILGVPEKSAGQGGLENLKDEVREINIETLSEQREILARKNADQRIDVVFPSKKAIKNYYNSFYNEVNYCLYPWARVVISPYGEVFPCVNLSMIDYNLGNIKDKPLRVIWNSPEFVAFRKKLKKNGLFPICSKCCVINNVKKL